MSDARSDANTFRDLVDYHCADLDDDARARVEAAIDASPDTASLADRLRRLLHALRESALEPPPEALLARLHDLLAAGPSTAPALAGADLIAQLTHDSREPEALMGYRGAPAAYQLTFRADGLEFILQLAASDEDPSDEGLVSVMGQVEGLDEDEHTGASIEFSTVAGQPVTRLPVDADGYFNLTIAPGTYDATLQTPRRKVIVPAIEIG